MLAAIRKFAKSWVALLLFIPLLLSFAIFGIPDVMRRANPNAVITAGSRTVDAAEFKREFEGMKRRAEQQMGQPVSTELAVENGLDRTVLEGLAGREALSEYFSRLGLKPSDKLLIAEIQKLPSFFDQISGRFDKALYERQLQENGLTVPKFEQMMRDEIAQGHFATAAVNGFRVPRAYAALQAIYGLETRDVSYFVLPAGSVPPPAQPTDAQLTQFMKENAAQLTRPEFRVLTIARFDPAGVSANIPIDPKELEQRYNFRKDTLSQPETRSLVQIPAKDAAAATRIAGRLSKGEDPKAVAKAEGVDAIEYLDKPKSAIADKAVAEAAFALAPGQVSGAIKGSLGLAVVKVQGVTPGKQVTLEEIRPQLEAELRKDAAAEKVYALTQIYDDAHAGGASLADAAKKAGVPAVTVGPVSAQGGDLQNQPVAGLDAKVLATAFALPTGGESELVDAGNGAFYAVRVEKIMPPAMPPLAEVRGELARVWMGRDLTTRLQAKADGLVARAKKGESLEAVAKDAGTPVAKLPALSRTAASQMQNAPRELLVKTFGAKPGDVFTAGAGPVGIIVAKLDGVTMTAGPNVARLTEQARQPMSMGVFESLMASARAASREKLKVKVDRNLARQAIGLEPLAEAGKGEKAGKAEKSK